MTAPDDARRVADACRDGQHKCIALSLAFFSMMAAVEQTPGLAIAAAARCDRSRAEDVRR